MGQSYELVKDCLAELEEMKEKAEKILEERQCITLKELAVDGRDVIAAGIEPGPEVGRVLNELLEQVVNGEFPNDRETLLRLLRPDDDTSVGV